MNYKLQLLSLIFSFFFGNLFSVLVRVNQKIIVNKNKILQIILTFIFILDIVLLYLICIYKINKGVVHCYFVLMIVAGYMFETMCLKVLSKRVKWPKLIDKVLHK